MSIIYHKGDLFTAPATHILLHAVNCQGSWGAGVAKQFHTKYPKAFEWYNWKCIQAQNEGVRLTGRYGSWIERARHISWIYTSYKYGADKDPVGRILQNTHAAISSMLYTLSKDCNPDGYDISSPKINAGLFGVPWEDTEQIINDALKWYPDLHWHVWEL